MEIYITLLILGFLSLSGSAAKLALVFFFFALPIIDILRNFGLSIFVFKFTYI